MSDGWSHTQLGNICIVDWGNTKLTKKAFVEGGEFLAVSAAGCDGRIGHFEHPKHTPVLSAIGANCGRMFFPEEDFTAIKNTITLSPIDDDLDRKFLYFLLTSVKLPQRGAGQPFISKGDIQKFPVSIPPLAEQKRIVAILDEAFGAIERAKRIAEKNLSNAIELFDSYLNRVFTEKGEGWEEKEIQDNIKFIDYRGKTPKKVEAGMRLITAKNVKMGFLQVEPREFVEPSIYDEWMTRGIPKKGDVLFTTEAPLGNVAQLDTSDKVVFAQRIIIMQPDEQVIRPTFLKFALLSGLMQNRIQDRGTGATAKGIKSKLLKTVPIPYPQQLAEQQRLENIFADLWDSRNSLSEKYKSKLSALDELKQSILQKAFTGQLTAKSPELEAVP